MYALPIYHQPALNVGPLSFYVGREILLKDMSILFLYKSQPYCHVVLERKRERDIMKEVNKKKIKKEDQYDFTIVRYFGRIDAGVVNIHQLSGLVVVETQTHPRTCPRLNLAVMAAMESGRRSVPRGLKGRIRYVWTSRASRTR